MKQPIQTLIENIEIKRLELNNISKQYDIRSIEVFIKSQELDMLLNQFYKYKERLKM